MEPTENRDAYARLVRRRLRTASIAGWLRAGGIQVVWLVVIVAGAAIPLSEALADDGWTWVSPVLGFVIVVAAGLERIFSRTTDAAVSLDELRRQLSREHRMLLAGVGGYAAAEDPFALFASRAEEHLRAYDDTMVDYHRRVLTGGGAEAG